MSGDKKAPKVGPSAPTRTKARKPADAITPGLIFEEVSDGFRTRKRARLTETATLEDAKNFWDQLAVPPSETIHEELARRASEIEARLTAIDATADAAIPAKVAAIRQKVTTAGVIATLPNFKPRQVREQLEAVEPLFFEIEVLVKLVPKARKAVEHGKTQAKRRAGKPGVEPNLDLDRNDRLRAHHARLVQQQQHDATSQTASAFNLSCRQTRRILAG